MFRLYARDDQHGEYLKADVQTYEEGLNKVYSLYVAEPDKVYSLQITSGGELFATPHIGDIQNALEVVKVLAPTMVGGLIDPASMNKYTAEWSELVEALQARDTSAALLEAADCFYYIAKAFYTGIICEADVYKLLFRVAAYSYFEVSDILITALIKFSSRSVYGKYKDVEHKTVTSYFEGLDKARNGK